MLPVPLRVERVRRETIDTMTLEFGGEGAFSPFRPGQFNMIYLFGVGEIPISICGDPALPQKLVHTTRVVGTVTKAMGQLKKMDQVGIRGPFGSFWPLEEAQGKDVLLVAGGIGLAPLRPVVLSIMKNRKAFGRVVLLYGVRTPSDILYQTDLKKWKSKMNVLVTVDRSAGKWKGPVGVVTSLIPRAPLNPKQTIAMICGPEIMMKFTISELEKRGVPKERLYLSMERNMKCAVGFCGHCQWGPAFVCKDGPVFRYDRIHSWFNAREV
ncbi:MAG: Anaerobic sulfite reductase subunit B [Elusimicrobia bacterium]|nr:Anaerobic sulfite reductase subunit B [Elusimicrobiota bacterium]